MPQRHYLKGTVMIIAIKVSCGGADLNSATVTRKTTTKPAGGSRQNTKEKYKKKRTGTAMTHS